MTEPGRDTTIASILRDAAAHAPDTCALVEGVADPSARRRWTYAEAAAEAEVIARVLASRHEPGERIAVLAPSLPEMYLLMFATAMARLVFVPMNPLLRRAEIGQALHLGVEVVGVHVEVHTGMTFLDGLDDQPVRSRRLLEDRVLRHLGLDRRGPEGRRPERHRLLHDLGRHIDVDRVQQVPSHPTTVP